MASVVYCVCGCAEGRDSRLFCPAGRLGAHAVQSPEASSLDCTRTEIRLSFFTPKVGQACGC
eukprot:5489692-Prymnesium_polylepis.1